MTRKTKLRIRDNKQLRRWKQRTRYEYMTTAFHLIPLTDEQRYAAVQSHGKYEDLLDYQLAAEYLNPPSSSYAAARWHDLSPRRVPYSRPPSKTPENDDEALVT